MVGAEMTAPKLHIVRPLAAIVEAEQRVLGRTQRDFQAEPWLTGEDVTYWTVERVAELKAANEAIRAARKARGRE